MMIYIAITIATLILAAGTVLALNAVVIWAASYAHAALLNRVRMPMPVRFLGYERRGWFRYAAVFERTPAAPDAAADARPTRYSVPVTALFRHPARAVPNLRPGTAITIRAHPTEPKARALVPTLTRYEVREAIRLSTLLLIIIGLGFGAREAMRVTALPLGLDARFEIAGRLIVCATEHRCKPQEALEHFVIERCERRTARETCDWPSRSPQPRPPRQGPFEIEDARELDI
ncbi:MAG: hypothetical protein AAGG99_07245 [Pseudomonadota bacterium]